MTASLSATHTTAAGPVRRRPAARVWVTILSLLVLVVPYTAANASSSGTAEVQVYFSAPDSECDVVHPFSRTVPTPRVLTGALEQLLAGPTAEEEPVTATMFSSATEGMLRSVNIRDGVAHVDFADLRPVIPNASSSCGSAALLSQLDATATQFSTVQRARYSINGSEATFYNWLQLGVPGRSTVTATRGSLTNTATIRRTRGGDATLRRVRVGRHDGFDRLVFEFDGGRPAYTVSYTGVARMDGGGVPIPVLGTTALQIDLWARTVDMEATGFPRTFAPVGPLTPRFPTLRQVRYAGEYEAVATFAAGLRGRSGFRVLELANPTRLAIDVAHGATVRRLRQGDRGADVRDWQEQLNMVQSGFFAVSRTPSVSPLATDGVFGLNTRRATRVFQRAEGVPVDGVVGSQTRAAMRHALRVAATIMP